MQLVLNRAISNALLVGLHQGKDWSEVKGSK